MTEKSNVLKSFLVVLAFFVKAFSFVHFNCEGFFVLLLPVVQAAREKEAQQIAAAHADALDLRVPLISPRCKHKF